MWSRITLALLLCAAGAPLFAFFAQPPGYVLSEIPQTSGTGGVVWDPASSATDFYASHDGGVRRFDTVGGAFAGTPIFPAPSAIAPAAYAFFDALAIDPSNTDDFYVSYSGQFSRMYKLTRTGPDASTTVTSFDYDANGEYIYELKFVPDNASVPAALRGQLIAVAGVGFSGVSNVYVVNTTTLALTPVIEVTSTQSSGPITVDEAGNIYTVVSPTFGTPTGTLLYKFDAADVATAISATPLQPSQAEVLISAADNEYNILDITAREENGSTFIYYATEETSSLYRLCVQTGESEFFMQGFGGTANGYPAHSAVTRNIAFTSTTGNFSPSGGGSVQLVVPFSVGTVGFGSYHGLYFLDPESVNIAVNSLTITQQPTGVNNGSPFSVTLQALNSSSTPLLSNVAVVASATGSGELHGFTVTSQPGDNIVVDGLVYTTSTVPETITLTFELAGNASVSVATANIQVIAPATGLTVTAPPSSPERNTFFSTTAELRNAADQLVSEGADSTREVTVSVSSGPGDIWGITTVTASGGVAQFDTLFIDTQGNYVLDFDSPGLPTQSLNVTVANNTGGSGSGSDDSNGGSGCVAASSGHGWLALLGILGLIVVAARFRRVASR